MISSFIRKRGMIMVTVLLLMPICIMLGAIMLSNIVSEKHYLRYERDRGQSYYLAELGVNAGYYCFSESNFSQFTHVKGNGVTDPDQAGTVETDPYKALKMSPVISAKIPFTRVSGGTWAGWFEYTWTPTSSHSSLTNSGLNEAIRVRVTQTYTPPGGSVDRPRAWEVVCVAQLGGITKTHRLSGDVEGITHAIFDAGDLNEFIRGANQSIVGRVHANGDIYLKPSGTVLSINTSTPDGLPGLTTAGRFWWGTDATGRTNMGEVRVDNVGPITSADKWPNNLDSRSSNWITQAAGLWGGTVQDEKLGATVKGVPPTKSFDPDGYYATMAQSQGINLKASGSTVTVNGSSLSGSPLSDAISMRTFYNKAEEKTVTAVQIDMSRIQRTDFVDPNQLLIYSERPLIIVNAQSMPRTYLNPDYNPTATPVYNPTLDYSNPAVPPAHPNSRQYLPVKTTVVGQSGVYTVGDYNKQLATEPEYKLNQRTLTAAQRSNFGLTQDQWKAAWETDAPAAIMTKNRIWHVSSSFPFSNSSSQSRNNGNDNKIPVSPASPNGDGEYLGDNRFVNFEAGNDDKSVIEVNGLLMDGAPLNDEKFNRIVKTREDGTQYLAPRYGPDRPGDNPTAQSASWDDYLENFSNKVVKKRGSIVHLQNGELPGVANFNQSNGNGTPDSQVAWYRTVFYDAPLRDYAYRADTVRDAAYAPTAANRTMWARR